MTADDTTKPPCPRCGNIHPRCTGHKAGHPDTPCSAYPVRGMRVCVTHGGASPQAIAARDRREALAGALEELDTFGRPREVDPHNALLEVLHHAAGVVDYLAAVVQAQESNTLVWGQTMHKDGGDDRGTTYAAGTNQWVKLLGEWSDRKTRAATACVNAGIAERQILIAESQGRILGTVVSNILVRMYEALESALGPYDAARVVVEQMWPQTVADVVPTELRSAIPTLGSE